MSNVCNLAVVEAWPGVRPTKASSIISIGLEEKPIHVNEQTYK